MLMCPACFALPPRVVPALDSRVGFAVDTHTHTGLLAKIHRATLAARKELDRPYDLCQ